FHLLSEYRKASIPRRRLVMTFRRVTASGFDVNLRVCRAVLALFAVIATVLTISIAHAQTLTVLHTFQGAPDGREPLAGVIMDAPGILYGTTYGGGTNEVVFFYKVAHRGSGWVLSPLYSFQGGLDGSAPVAGVTRGPDGNLYGTASSGGQHHAGVV